MLYSHLFITTYPRSVSESSGAFPPWSHAHAHTHEATLNSTATTTNRSDHHITLTANIFVYSVYSSA